MSGGPSSAAATVRSDATVSSLLLTVEASKREIAARDADLARLRKLLDDKERRLDDATAYRASTSRELEKLGREHDRLTRECTALRSDKSSAEAKVSEQAAYIRKLEARLTSGGKDFLIDQVRGPAPPPPTRRTGTSTLRALFSHTLFECVPTVAFVALPLF